MVFGFNSSERKKEEGRNEGGRQKEKDRERKEGKKGSLLAFKQLLCAKNINEHKKVVIEHALGKGEYKPTTPNHNISKNNENTTHQYLYATVEYI